MYVGGVDPSLAESSSSSKSALGIRHRSVPPTVWSSALGYGFVGCLRDVVVNGHTVDVAEYANVQDSGSVKPTCQLTPPKCERGRCLNGGECREGWNRYSCDCSKVKMGSSVTIWYNM